MTGLPVPRLTATIAPPSPARHALGRVTVHGYTPPPAEREPRADRSNATVRCSRCRLAGLDGTGHASHSANCPSRVTPTSEQAAVVARIRATRPAPRRRLATTLSRCAARYAWLCRCSLGEAAVAFGLTTQAVRYAWVTLYPTVSVRRGLR